MDYLKTLHELCETISRELEDCNEKIRKAGGKLSAGDVDYIDKLTHSLKSVKASIAMMEDEAENGDYSGARMPMYGRMSYGGSYNGGSYAGDRMSDGRGSSYARGRMNARRDSMGRYSGERGYSRAGGMVEDLRELMHDAPDERTREKFRRFIEEIEMM